MDLAVGVWQCPCGFMELTLLPSRLNYRMFALCVYCGHSAEVVAPDVHWPCVTCDAVLVAEAILNDGAPE